MPRKTIAILSAFHDYRTAKRASIQQIADGLVELGHDVSFISTRFSRLSKIVGDSRLFLWDKANKIEIVNGIRCYLWRTPVHPFQSRQPLVNAAMTRLFPIYAEAPNRQFDQLLRDADYLIVESSVAAIFMRRMKRLNPDARIIYYAADRLDTVGAHPFVHRRLIEDAALIDHVCLRSPKMALDFAWAEGKLYRAEFGVNTEEFDAVGPTPYPADRKTAVSVGSMLFDASFFALAAPLFPDIDFHVIGCGAELHGPPNLHVHPEMRFRDTLPFVKHAILGIAPYRPAPGVEYLAESSLKMAQYGFFALPTICPEFAVGDASGRFGYRPGDAESIRVAVASALDAAGHVAPHSFPTWRQVAERVLDPRSVPALDLNHEAG
jgi:2-beta-glucuronyltransferase